MANLAPFQVIVKFGDGTRKEYGFRTVMERRIYLWGVRDAAGKEIVDIDKHNYVSPCMACNSRPMERTYLREKPISEGTFAVVELCELCSRSIIRLSMPYLAEGGGRFVGEKETFGLTKFEDLVRETGLPED